MSTQRLLFSGFGGQGILFAGKFIAYIGMVQNLSVSWLPSYGPEMRGGTASCGVVLTEREVGSPIVDKPDVLIAMNLPSLDRYEDSVVPGGWIFADSTLIERKVKRTDVNVCYVPATRLASENGMPTLANMILAGKIIKQFGYDDPEVVKTAIGKVISAKHADMMDVNLRALQIGADYQA